MTRFSYETSPTARATFGLLTLVSDETVEPDLMPLLSDGESRLHVARVENAPEVSAATLAAMAETIPAAARRLPPSARFDAVGYACTSGASVIGADRVADLVQAGCSTRAVTDPLTALTAACAALGIGRLAILSPYVAEVSERLCGALADRGIETPVFGSFEEASEARVARIAPASVISAATRLGGEPGAEAIFLSCTNLRAMGCIAAVEAATGKPVLASNQVLAWHMCRLAGVGTARVPGRLGAPAPQAVVEPSSWPGVTSPAQ